MTEKKHVHIISHSHWDREWYLPFEKHHVRLVRLMDTLLKTLAEDSEYKSFHLDGQTIVLDDYLEVRPEMKDQLKKYIQEGRIHIGPWYIQQDEFLISSEANIRNLLYGMKDTSQWGAVTKVGYLPDSFGNIGQAPQILQQAGIDTAVFGRGVKPTGFANMVSESASYESPFSEMAWRAPDGSSVLGILFANWYCNGNEIPVQKEEATDYWQQRITASEKYASTPHLLMMNGCDHQPIQTDLTEAIRTAENIYPEVTFSHSNFKDYIQEVKNNLPSDIKRIDGELRSQRTDGWGTLVNTASSRIYLKQMNQACQTLLEKVAEPLATQAYLLGEEYPHHLFQYAWKTLMQNHPHDSICGCGVDEVHREMETRFEKSKQVTETIVQDSLQSISNHVDTRSFGQWGENGLPFQVFNTTGWERSGVVSVDLDVKREYFSAGVSKQTLKDIDIEGKVLVDDDGSPLDCTVEDLGIHFGYDLPEDQFRQPYMARKVRLTFEAVCIPALGEKTYAWVDGLHFSQAASFQSSLLVGGDAMENSYLHVKVKADGSLTLTEKQSGRTFDDLCVYEDVGDIGNEYMFKQPEDEAALTTKGQLAKIRVLEDTSFQAAFEIIHEWKIPSGAEALLQTEMQELVPFSERKAQRTNETIPFTITTVVRLEKHSKGLDVTTSFYNQARNHRLRALFPIDLDATSHVADSVFELAERGNIPAPEWTNPDHSQHQQAFVSQSNGEVGLTIANQGLNEYEVLRDGRNTMAVTLLRSVGEMGDWGYFPTPEAQCLGDHTQRFKIIPHQGSGLQSGAYQEAYQFQIPWSCKQTGIHAGDVPATFSPLQWNGETLAFSTMKVSEDTGDVVLRWFNMAEENQQFSLDPAVECETIYASNVLEQQLAELPQEDRIAKFDVKPCEIVTLGAAVKGMSCVGKNNS